MNNPFPGTSPPVVQEATCSNTACPHVRATNRTQERPGLRSHAGAWERSGSETWKQSGSGARARAEGGAAVIGCSPALGERPGGDRLAR